MADKESKNKEPSMSPKEYFDLLKGRRSEANVEEIQQLHASATAMMKKYIVTGQSSGAEKLYNFILLCEREIEAVKHGINTYVERKDIDEFITKIADKTVCIIDLPSYEREIPDEIIDKIAELKEAEIFDKYYVVFTDYTGEVRSKVQKERREKDPILFGALTVGNQVSSRLYYIADWVDECCDLTLDSLVKAFADKNKPSPVQNIRQEYPDVESIREAIKKFNSK